MGQTLLSATLLSHAVQQGTLNTGAVELKPREVMELAPSQGSQEALDLSLKQKLLTNT